VNPLNDENSGGQILSIEDILKLQTDKKDVQFLAELSFERVRQKIHSDDNFIAQFWEYRDTNTIIERLEIKRCSYTEKVKNLVSLNELMFEDCIATEYELFSLGFGYGRSSVKTEDDENLYGKMKTEIEQDSKVHDFFLQWRMERESKIRYQCPGLYADIEKYKNLKRYLETTDVQNTEPDAPAAGQPEYIQKMIDKAYLLKDGKTAVQGLQKIADFLARQGINVTKDLLYLQIRKKDGNPFSESSCEDAARLAMTKPLKAR